jgi:hypothetical protein
MSTTYNIPQEAAMGYVETLCPGKELRRLTG